MNLYNLLVTVSAYESIQRQASYCLVSDGGLSEAVSSLDSFAPTSSQPEPCCLPQHKQVAQVIR